MVDPNIPTVARQGGKPARERFCCSGGRLAHVSRLNRLQMVQDFASPVRLRRRLPGSVDKEGFALTGPRRHRGTDRVERLVAVAAELKMGAGRYRERYAGAELDDLLISAAPAPHAPRPGDAVPTTVHRPVGARFRNGGLRPA